MRQFLIFLALALSACATVRQQDLDAWVGVPVEALDTHSFFLTLPSIKTITDSGIEIRVYPNKQAISNCGNFGTGTINSNGYMAFGNFQNFRACSSNLVGCDNIFYIKDRKVLEYKPVGRCYTDDRVRPEPNFERFLKK